jgi:hypothetical protein
VAFVPGGITLGRKKKRRRVWLWRARGCRFGCL